MTLQLASNLRAHGQGLRNNVTYHGALRLLATLHSFGSITVGKI